MHLSLFGGLGDRGDRSEKMSTGRLVRSGHIWSYIHIYICGHIYIYIYIYVCSCSNLFQPWRIDEHRKIHENSPRYFLCDLKPPNTVGIRNPGPFWFNHEVLQIPMTVTYERTTSSGLGQLWAVFCGFPLGNRNINRR